jgi:hypothetical protein
VRYAKSLSGLLVSPCLNCCVVPVLGFPIFDQRNYFAEDETRRKGRPFRRNSASFAKRKKRGIVFRFVVQNGTWGLGFLFELKNFL